MHVLLVGPEFEENLSLRYLAAALRQAGHTASLARFDSPSTLKGGVSRFGADSPDLAGSRWSFRCEPASSTSLRAPCAGPATGGPSPPAATSPPSPTN